MQRAVGWWSQAIQGRDYARIYVKELDRGKASVALSPEEQEAVERAMVVSHGANGGSRSRGRAAWAGTFCAACSKSWF